MKIIIDMSIGMICTIVALIIIVIVAIWSCRNREKLTNHPIIAAIAIISLVLSVITVVFLYFSNYHIGDLSFNYSDASIAALSILTAFLVGWNIWSTIESKGIEKKIEEKFREIEDKGNCDSATTHSRYAQMLSIQIKKLDEGDIKALMVHYVINSIVRYEEVYDPQKFDNILGRINTVIETAIATFEVTPHINISLERATELLERFGEIKNPHKIDKLKVLKDKISEYIQPKPQQL